MQKTIESASDASWCSRWQATLEHLPALQLRIQNTLVHYGCPPHTAQCILIAVEEIFVNIVHYAYREKTGFVDIHCAMKYTTSETAQSTTTVLLTFRDKGVPFNPLTQPFPPMTEPAEKRAIGGLGIHMVSEIMDTIDYAYVKDENTLCITKKW